MLFPAQHEFELHVANSLVYTLILLLQQLYLWSVANSFHNFILSVSCIRACRNHVDYFLLLQSSFGYNYWLCPIIGQTNLILLTRTCDSQSKSFLPSDLTVRNNLWFLWLLSIIGAFKDLQSVFPFSISSHSTLCIHSNVIFQTCLD